jgi:hypothetical protein
MYITSTGRYINEILQLTALWFLFPDISMLSVQVTRGYARLLFSSPLDLLLVSKELWFVATSCGTLSLAGEYLQARK